MSAEERDTVVADALATIVVPDHGPGFWARLEDSMGEREVPAPVAIVPSTPATSVFADDGAEPDVTVAPASEVVLDDVPAAEPAGKRWGVGLARVLVAAAVVAVVAVAGVLVAQRDDTGPDLSDQTTASTVPGDTATTVAPAATATAEEQVVVDYLEALGRGDTQAAAALLGPRSEEYLEANGIPLDDFLKDEQDATGALATATDRSVRAVDGLAVVLVQGTVERDGVGKLERAAIPVVYANSAQAWFVDPWAFDPGVEDQRIDYLQPEPGELGVVLSPGGTVEVGFAEPGTAYFSLDGAAPTEVATTDSLVGHVAGWAVPEDATDGASVVVAFQSESGKTFVAQVVPVSAG